MAKLSLAQLALVPLKAEQMWKDGQYTADYVASVNGILAIKENQTAEIKPLSDSKKNYAVKINWLDTTAIIVKDKGVNAGSHCDLVAPEVDVKAQNYFIDTFLETGFSINEDEVKYSTYSVEELMARNMTDALNKLDEKVSVKSLAKAATYSGVNLFPLQYNYNAVTGETDVPASEYIKPEFFAWLRQTVEMNRMQNSYIIDAGSLYQQQIIVAANQANDNGKGAFRLYQDFKIYQDMRGMVSAGLTEDMLVVRKGALAFGHRVKYDTTPTEYGGKVNQTRFSVKSPNIPGLYYDAYYSLECVEPRNAAATGLEAPDGEETIKHVWVFVARTGLWHNPTGFTAGNTGLLSVNKA